MKKTTLAIFAIAVLFNTSCTKLNDLVYNDEKTWEINAWVRNIINQDSIVFSLSDTSQVNWSDTWRIEKATENESWNTEHNVEDTLSACEDLTMFASLKIKQVRYPVKVKVLVISKITGPVNYSVSTTKSKIIAILN